MSAKSVKIIILAFFILVVIGAIFFFFLIFKDNSPDNTSLPGTTGQTFFPVTTTFEEGDGSPLISEEDAEIIRSAENFVPRLRQLSQVPTSGATSFEREAKSSDLFIDEEGAERAKDTKETIFRYIERGTGHLFEATEKNLTQSRLSNVTMPKIQEAFFDGSGNKVVLRYLREDSETIETFLGTLKEATTTNEQGNIIKTTKIEGEHIDFNIDNLVIFENEINYLKRTSFGSDIFSMTFNNPSPQKVFSLSTSQWILQRPNKDIITMTTKADSRMPGFMFRYDLNTGKLFQILEDINGLTTLTSPDGKYVLLSQSRGSDLNLLVFNTEDKQFKRVGLDTLPEKCTWSKVEKTTFYCAVPDYLMRTNYPESWYQGSIAFEDSIWKVDIESELYDNLLPAYQETDQSFDIKNLIVSENDEYLLFINKNDLTLWSLDIKGN